MIHSPLPLLCCLPLPSSEFQLCNYHHGGGDDNDDNDDHGDDDDDVDQFSVFALGACAECVILAGEHKWILGAAESHIGKNKILAFCKSLPHTFFTFSSI